ncbi:MAG: hypothetical protein ACK53W_12540 [Gemmatimonadota bacterium]
MLPILPIIAAVLPHIAGPLAAKVAAEVAGPEVGATAKAVVDAAVAVAGSDDPAAVASAMTDPLKVAAFRTSIVELELEAMRIENADRADARAMHVATRDTVPRDLAYASTAMVFVCALFVMAFGLPEQGREFSVAFLSAIVTAWGTMMAFYFGSSRDAKRLGDAMQRIATSR